MVFYVVLNRQSHTGVGIASRRGLIKLPIVFYKTPVPKKINFSYAKNFLLENNFPKIGIISYIRKIIIGIDSTYFLFIFSKKGLSFVYLKFTSESIFCAARIFISTYIVFHFTDVERRNY